ncbi:MAG: sugar phosphate isomerase/epimerase [Undibacterium sp.]|nr:sugar phosphate isomerase/epimerase [Opitutaceae bacterium]
MKKLLRFILIAPLVAAALHAGDFRDHLGLQLYSLRAQTKESTTGALDLAKSYEVKEVELAATGNLTPEQFAVELKSRGFAPVSGHFGYALFEKDIAAVIRDAKTLGLKYVIVPYPPVSKDKPFTEETVHTMVTKFNEWGAACKKEGLQFGYHPHGLEFKPSAAGNGETMFDILVRETKADLVTYEMDVYWVYITGQEPAKLLAKYPDRWSLLHVKDMLKDFPRGTHTGGSPATAKVAVGAGQIDWSEVLAAAQKIGVKHYFLEDETTDPLRSIPESLKYLRSLKL